MTTVQYNGAVVTPASAAVAGPRGCSGGGFSSSMFLELEPLVKDFAQVECINPQVITPGGYVELGASLSTIQFIALSIDPESSPVDIILGAPPELVGAGGTFPTGFVGGETFTFEVTDQSTIGGTTNFTIACTFTAAAQTAVQVVAEINAAALLAGFPGVAAVAVGDVITLVGNVPGADQGVNVSLPNATIGFPTLGLLLGSGYPIPMASSLVVAVTPVVGAKLWVSGGPATLTGMVAGT